MHSTFRIVTLMIPLIAASVASPTGGPTAEGSTRCKLLPTDAAWPSARQWSQLNKTVSGRLIAAAPIASACHNPTYDSQVCTKLQDTWNRGMQPQAYHPVEVINPYFQGNSCSPFTDVDTPCEIGTLASYSVNVSSVSDIQASIRFATQNNVRLVIKNTGHDLLGKSTGKGSLSLWTHNMKTVEFIDSYRGDSSYTGTAVRLGAGIMFKDVLPVAQRRGLRVMAGSCATVGAAGGYTAGGGHGALTSMNGMAADSVLEWEVVTASGEHLIATPKRNKDLYWALSGGGAGTFAVVVSMTTRTFADGPMQWATFKLDAADTAFGGDKDALWSAVDVFHMNLGAMTDKGAVATYAMGATWLNVYSLAVSGRDSSVLKAAMDPFVSALRTHNVTLNVTSRGFDTFWDMHSTVFGAAEASSKDGQTAGGRLVLRSTLEDPAGAAGISDSFRRALEAGFEVSCTGLNGGVKVRPSHPNAVLPAWRNGLISCLAYKFWDFSATWDVNTEAQALLTRDIMPPIIAASPGGGAYLNEANFEEPDWQHSFYGANYPRLAAIKKKYDPTGLFYARTAVGSEGWAEDQDHRLCRI